MERSSHMGANRTGIQMSPLDTEAMVSGAEQYSPMASDGNDAFAAIEGQYISSATSVGSVPIPGTMKGMLKSMAKKMTGRNPEVFINKLGERLAYERTGVRLYESFIRKCEALNGEGIPPLPMADVWQIRNEEEQHFLLLQDCMKMLGADPTAQTPDADISGVAATGIMKVLTDPRTSVSQCLEMLVTIELTDNAAWELLMQLSNEMGLDEMTVKFGHARDQELEHLQRVRTWYESAVRNQLEMAMNERTVS